MSMAVCRSASLGCFQRPAACGPSGRACTRGICRRSRLTAGSHSPDAASFRDPAVPLPGAVWLRDPSFYPPTAFVQGDNFVWHSRPGFTVAPTAKQATTQLVPYSHPQHTSIQPMQREQPLPLVVSPAAGKSTAMVPVGFNAQPFAIISLLETSCDKRPGASEILPDHTCTAIIPHESAGSTTTEDEDVAIYETNNTSSPRRTHKIKFTCRVCNSINIKPINPHAWQKGSVFARCSGCNITHKLIDNLKLFHELSGPVFPRPVPEIEIPECLRLDPSAVHEERPIDSLWLLDINPEIGF